MAFGPSIALINADFDATREVFEEIREDLGAYRDGRGLSESDTRSVFGIHGEARARYQVNDKVFLEASAGYNWMDSVNYGNADFGAKLDPKPFSLGVRIGFKFQFTALFANAELAENLIQDFLAVDLADDLSESLEGFSKVEGNEFGCLGLAKGRGSGFEVICDALKAVLVPCVDGDGMISEERAAAEDKIPNGFAEHVNSIGGEARNGNGGAGGPGRVDGLIRFVENQNVSLTGMSTQGNAIGGLGWLAGIDDFQDKVRTLHFPCRAGNAGLLDGVVTLPKPCCVNQPKGDTVDLDEFFDGVSCRACSRTDDGALKAGEEIEEAGFTNIGLTTNDRACALTEESTVLGGGEELLGLGEKGGEPGL